jgi:hypothetical protein
LLSWAFRPLRLFLFSHPAADISPGPLPLVLESKISYDVFSPEPQGS